MDVVAFLLLFKLKKCNNNGNFSIWKQIVYANLDTNWILIVTYSGKKYVISPDNMSLEDKVIETVRHTKSEIYSHTNGRIGFLGL